MSSTGTVLSGYARAFAAELCVLRTMTRLLGHASACSAGGVGDISQASCGLRMTRMLMGINS